MALCQPVSTNQRLPFPSIISHKVSYMRVHMFIHRHKRWSTFFLLPPTSTPLATISLVYPLIVTLLWCFNTVLYLWSCFIYYLVLLCNIIYIQSKSYVNAHITLKEILLKSHEIMLISVNWPFNWVQKYCNDLPSTACIITSNQLWSEMHCYLTVTHISDCEINSVVLNTLPLICKCYKNGLCNITDWSNKLILSATLAVNHCRF